MPITLHEHGHGRNVGDMTDVTFADATPVLPVAGPVDNSRVWLLAVAPLLLLAVDAAFLYGGHVESNAAAWVIAAVVNVALAVWDSRYLRSRGVDVSAGWAAAIVPAYLWQRSKKLGASQAPMAAWLAALVLSVVGFVVISSHFVSLNRPMLENSISQWVTNNDGGSGAVTCPSRQVYSVHDTFICTVTGASVSSVLVTVENSSGDVTWQAVG